MKNFKLNQYVNFKKHQTTLVGVFFLIFIATLSLIHVMQLKFWPQNHEGASFFLRTVVYTEHFQQGDWLPIWSVADNHNMGSPQPILYHKLFYLMSGLGFFISGDLKLSILITIWLFLILGGLGMYFLCRSVECSKISSWAGAVLLIVSNYTVTNWLVRGAMAEFSAAMLVPGVLALYHQWIQEEVSQRKVSAFFGISMGLIFLAHSVLAFYLVLFCIVTTLILMLIGRIKWSSSFLKKLILSFFCFFLITGPCLLLMKMMGDQYDMGRITPKLYSPVEQFKPLIQYFFDRYWKWGRTWQGYTVKIDSFVIIFLFLGLLNWLHKKFFIQSISKNQKRTSLPSKVIISILFMLLFSFWLQTRTSSFFYQYVPGAKYIQFPWRLLAVITPLSIVLSFLVIKRYRFPPVIVMIGVMISVASSGVWSRFRYEQVFFDNQLDRLVFSAYGEYLPKSVSPKGYSENVVNQAIKNIDCDLHQKTDESGFQRRILHEPLTMHYELSCSSEGIVPLPFYHSGYHQIKLYEKQSLKMISVSDCLVHPEYPGLCAVRVHQGRYLLTIMHPTAGRLFQKLLKELISYFF